MVFNSDRQRKGFFANQGNVRSNVNPSFVIVDKRTGQRVSGVFTTGQRFRTKKLAQREIVNRTAFLNPRGRSQARRNLGIKRV